MTALNIMTALRPLLFTVGMTCVLSAHAWEGPTTGWSSWNTYRNQISEELIRSQADALVSSGLRDAGYIYVNIDDGAFDGREDDGTLRVNSQRFPNGLSQLVDYIHSLGLKAGTYSDAGRNTCASFWDDDEGGVDTGLLGHDKEDMDLLLNKFGFDFIKVDFCGGDSKQNTDHLDLDESLRYTQIRDAIRSTGREDVRLNVCRWDFPGTWVSDVASSWRISEDIRPAWWSVRGIIDQNLYLSAYASKGRFNDMDMLEVGRGLSPEEDKTHFGMWCIMSSPLLIGCDLTSISPHALALLSNPELIAINQDSLAVQAYVAEVNDGVYLLVKDLHQPHSHSRAIAVYNPTDSPQMYHINFSSVDLEGHVDVRDAFERQDLGTFESGFDVNVPAHGTRIYTLYGEHRLERSRYEAETGWLSAYQELIDSKTAESATYEPDPLCSGEMKASGLGMRHDNDIRWTDIWSEHGGNYNLSIACVAPQNRRINVEVNGLVLVEISYEGENDSHVVIQEIPVLLNAGSNTIRLYNTSDPMPDIDYIELIPCSKD